MFFSAKTLSLALRKVSNYSALRRTKTECNSPSKICKKKQKALNPQKEEKETYNSRRSDTSKDHRLIAGSVERLCESYVAAVLERDCCRREREPI